MDPAEKKTDIEAAPRYTKQDDDHATLNEERKNSAHTLKAGDVLQKAGIDGDEALKALDMEEGEVIVIDEETNRKLMRKIGIPDKISVTNRRSPYYAFTVYNLRTAIS
jgi:hypothetical protein